VVGNEVDQLGLEDCRYFGRPARKAILQHPVSRIEDDGGDGPRSECVPDKATVFFGMRQVNPDDWKLLLVRTSSTILSISESPRQCPKLGCQGLASLAPRAKDLQHDQFVGILFQKGSEFFFGRDVIQSILADFWAG